MQGSRRMQFSQPRRKNFDKRGKALRSLSEFEKIFLQPFFYKQNLQRVPMDKKNAVSTTLSNVLTKRQNFLAQCRRWLKRISNKNHSPQKVRMDTWSQISRAQPENFARRPNNFHSLSEYGKSHLNFSENSFSQKYSSGQVDCSFDNSIEKFLPEDPKKLPAHCMIMIKNFQPSQKNKLSSKFSGHEEFHFDDRAPKFLPNYRKILAQCTNTGKKSNFLSKRNFSQNVPLNT